MVDFGGIIGSAAGWLGNQNSHEAQSRSNQQYQNAFGEYTDESQAAQQAMQQYLAAQQGAGYQGSLGALMVSRPARSAARIGCGPATPTGRI